MKPIPKDKWRFDWTEMEVKQLCQMAESFVLQGALNDESAWHAAEQQLFGRIDPYLRK